MSVIGFNNVTELVGNTPLISVANLFSQNNAQVFAKTEYFNPGLSIKDRIAINIITKAEENGDIGHGTTIIESSSGNTGVGLAIISAVRGYRFICVMNTKHSPTKINLMKSYGAEIILCEGSYPYEHPDSHYTYAKNLAEEIPNSYHVNQYQNQLNPDTHYEKTGHEIWEQTHGKITHLVASASTGGTITGIARYLKEQNPDIKVWAPDAYGSAFQHFHQTGEYDPTQTHSYLIENVGKKFIPDVIDIGLINQFIKVKDKDAALMARKAARKTGLLLGYSSGAALRAFEQMQNECSEDDVVVIVCSDHGSRYMSTIYNDDWMAEHHFTLENKQPVTLEHKNGSI
jgi:cystathionine beta-synthase